MPKLHKEILTPDQTALLPAIKPFSKKFGLVGGTAVALHIGHRESIDFDLFTKDPESGFSAPAVKKTFRRQAAIGETLRSRDGELTFMSGDVKITFFHFDYRIPFKENLDDIIKIPTLLTLAAMKAFAFGHRAKWKDYVDMYFIMRGYHSLKEIAAEARKLFGGEFNEKIFRMQLAYFKDINYSEEIKYLKGFEVSDGEVRKTLLQASLN